MKLDAFHPKKWKIPSDLGKSLSTKNIEPILNSFNRVSENTFIIVDYHKQKLIVGASSAEILTGHSQNAVKKEGWNFYRQILKTREQNWLKQVNIEALKILYQYPENKRQNLEFSYDLIAQTTTRSKVILRHKLVPYQFCKNGNLWMSLCFVTETTSVRTPKASIIDTKTGKKYDFISGKFQISNNKVLTQEHVRILQWMAHDFSSEDICEMLSISGSNLKQKKRIIYDILGVKSSAGATYKARDLEII